MSTLTINAMTTNNDLVKAARAGNAAAMAELRTRAERNGPKSRAAHAVATLDGKSDKPASYGEFFEHIKNAPKTAKPKVKTTKSAAAPAAKTTREKATSAWNFVSPVGKKLDAKKFAEDVSTVASMAVKSAIINALTNN